MDPKEILKRLDALQPEFDRAADVHCATLAGKLRREFGRVPTEAEVREWLASDTGQAALHNIIKAAGAHVWNELQEYE